VFSLPEMRDAQMLAADSLPNIGWATNADRGDVCNIHPGAKQFCGRRLADSALALIHGHAAAWRSPRFSGAKQLAGAAAAAGTIAVAVSLTDVGAAGLDADVYPWNMDPLKHAGENRSVTNCTMGSAVNNVANQSANQCAWAGIEVEGVGWLNATVTASADGGSLRLQADLPQGAGAGAEPRVTGSAYGWGAIPMMNAYDRASGLPVLAWNRSI
jgi:hypothetical protein